MWPFKSKAFLDEEPASWHVDNFCWFIKHFHQTPMFENTSLILPSPGFFQTEAIGHERAMAIFEKVKSYAGMEDWPVELLRDDEIYEPNKGDLIQIPSENLPLGSFGSDGDSKVFISYNPSILDDPVSLIATFAHELSHYLIRATDDDLPCEDDEEEFLTDQLACFLGFGVFMANNVFGFEQWRDDISGTQGWQAKRRGYLPEDDMIFNLALFLSVKNIAPNDALKHLKPHLAKQLKLAIEDVKKWDDCFNLAKQNSLSFTCANS